MRIASGLATTVALLIGWTSSSWAQGPGVPASTMLTVGLVAVIVVAIVVLARYMAARRKRIDEAVILQSQLSDALAREPQLHGAGITPRARVFGWRAPQITIEVAGEVPTPELRETVMRIASAEARRLRPDLITVDHLFIVPPLHQTSDSIAPRR
jgi:hypothetical protein